VKITAKIPKPIVTIANGISQLELTSLGVVLGVVTLMIYLSITKEQHGFLLELYRSN
jgi:hypothetical protein